MHDLEAIVRAHSESVWRTVYRLLNNREDALDCYQETFLTALRLPSADAIRDWRAMLPRIATAKAIDRLRQRYATQKLFDNLSRVAPTQASVSASELQAQGEEFFEAVRRALAALPPQQAEAFWLRHLEQLNPSDVAELMRIEPGHVRVLVHRAAAALRTLLGSSYGPASFSKDSS